MASRLLPNRERFRTRLIDLIIGIPLALATVPLIVLLLLGSAATFRANPIFVQTRIGRGGREFSVFKIRTLSPDVDSKADKYVLSRESLSRYGARLRGTHLDELPQLWNVVGGSMSLVGHRPEMPHLAERFSQEQKAARDSIKPGLTGPWQLSADSGGLMCEHPEYDVWYASNRSLMVDLNLLLRTPAFVAGRWRFELPSELVDHLGALAAD